MVLVPCLLACWVFGGKKGYAGGVTQRNYRDKENKHLGVNRGRGSLHAILLILTMCRLCMLN
jgi:hypothetical protein